MDNKLNQLKVTFFKCWCDVVIWIVGSAILVFLAVNEFRPLLDEYQNNNVATWLKVVGKNDTVKPPSLTLCIPRKSSLLLEIEQHLQNIFSNRSSKCDHCEKMANKSWDAWIDINVTDRTLATEWAVSEALMIRLLDQSNADRFNIVSVNNFDWNQPLIDAVWNYYMRIWMMDVDFANISRMGRSLESHLSNKSGVDRLFESLIGVLCEHVEIQYPKRQCVRALSDAPSIMEWSKFCYQLPTASEGADGLINATSKYGVLTGLNVTEDPYLVFLDTDMITWSRVQGKAPLLKSEAFSEEVDIRYLVIVTAVEKREIDCYEDDTGAQCKGLCLGRKIVQICKCIPFTYRRYAPPWAANVSYCNTTYYADCNFNKSTEMKKCDVRCSIPCKHTTYQWHITRQAKQEAKARSLRFSFTPIHAPFIEFTITTKNTREQFFSQIGSVLNFYLGFSGISLIVLILRSAHFIKSRYYSRKEKSDKLAHISTLHLERSNFENVSNSSRLDVTDQNGESGLERRINRKIENLNMQLLETQKTVLDILHKLEVLIKK